MRSWKMISRSFNPKGTESHWYWDPFETVKNRGFWSIWPIHYITKTMISRRFSWIQSVIRMTLGTLGNDVGRLVLKRLKDLGSIGIQSETVKTEDSESCFETIWTWRRVVLKTVGNDRSIQSPRDSMLTVIQSETVNTDDLGAFEPYNTSPRQLFWQGFNLSKSGAMPAAVVGSLSFFFHRNHCRKWSIISNLTVLILSRNLVRSERSSVGSSNYLSSLVNSVFGQIFGLSCLNTVWSM